MELRKYQKRAVAHMNNFKGNRLGVQLPTGTGKTFTIAKFIEDNPGKRIVFCVSKIMLVDQTMESFSHLNPERIQGPGKYNDESNLFVASIQTLVRRDIGTIDYIIFDEFHTYGKGQTIQRIIRNLGDPVVIGLSATLYTSNGEALDFFDEVYNPHAIKWFVDNGYLKNMDIVAPHTPNLEGQRVINGDYVEADIAKVMLMSNIPEKTQSYLRGKTTVVFATTIHHAKKLTSGYKKLGFKVGLYHSKMTPLDKELSLKRIKDRTIDIIVSVTSLTAGFDSPSVNCVVVARPTLSIPLWVQMVGRGLRPFDNDRCLLVDCGNCTIGLGHPLEKIKPYELKDGMYTVRCEHCRSTQLSIIEKDTDLKGSVKVVQECNTCGHHQKREIQPKAKICEKCKNYISVKHSRTVETGNSLQFSTICPNCSYEKVYRAISLIKDELHVQSESEMRDELVELNIDFEHMMRNYSSSKDKSEMRRILDRINELEKLLSNQDAS